ncbi:hypothetical protein [Shewanella algae]|uniref:hypothetical protein n=1 Tax=Shewanella algae TaxID=38313 RepID=UPI0016434647|nr:hypothetical protein [Shewanella algae]MBC8795177.1 hypothetical protein [Shewanella algae]
MTTSSRKLLKATGESWSFTLSRCSNCGKQVNLTVAIVALIIENSLTGSQTKVEPQDYTLNPDELPLLL